MHSYLHTTRNGRPSEIFDDNCARGDLNSYLVNHLKIPTKEMPSTPKLINKSLLVIGKTLVKSIVLLFVIGY